MIAKKKKNFFNREASVSSYQKVNVGAKINEGTLKTDLNQLIKVEFIF